MRWLDGRGGRRRVWGMRYFLLIIAVVALVGCGGKKPKQQAEANATVTPKPESPKAVTVNITNPIVEKAIRKSLEKPEGKLTEADLAKVTSLNLSDTQITDAGLNEVAKLQQLTDLYLDYTKITDAGLKEVAKMKQLEWLGLHYTKITDAGLFDVAKLQKLTYLELGNTKVTKAGVAELKKALPKCKIRSNPTK